MLSDIEMSSDGDDTRSLQSTCTDLNTSQFENVHGVQSIDVAGHARCALTTGWVAICVATFALQMLVLLVNLRHGLDYYAGCFEEDPSVLRWWLLHVSKACAMVIAGVLMGK